MKSSALTAVGKVRSINQDYIFSSSEPVGPLPDLHVVADGMGGHQAGDYASRYMVEQLVTYLQCASEGQTVALLHDGIQEVNRRLYRESLKDSSLLGMGTTLVAAVVAGSTLYVANVGDSRLYLIRDDIRQITRDHSYVEELVSMGRMKRYSQDYLQKKNIITRAVGTGEFLDIDFFEVSLVPGDLILLCSDGLTNMVSDGEIRQLVQAEKGLREKAESLVAAANDHGGQDNIAVILIDPQVSEEVGAC